MTDEQGNPANWAWTETEDAEHWHPVASREEALADARAALTIEGLEMPGGIWLAPCIAATQAHVDEWDGDLELGQAMVDLDRVEHLPDFAKGHR